MKYHQPLVVAAALLFAAPVCFGAGASLSAPSVSSSGLQLSTNQRNATYSLTITGGPGVAIHREYAYGGTITVDDSLPDGQYSWELRVGPTQTYTRTEKEATTPVGDLIPAAGSLEKEAATVQWGYFHIVNGAYLVPGSDTE